MPATPSPRMKFIGPTLADPPNVPADFARLITELEVVTPGGLGTLSQRPVSTPSNPGTSWRVFVVTDQAGGPRLDIDIGTGWVTIGPSVIAALAIATGMIQDGAVTQAKLALLAVGTPQLIDLAVVTAKLADGAVTAAKIANALKPSTGAGATTESLRALGTAPGQALPGNYPFLAIPGAGAPCTAKTFQSDPIIGTGALGFTYNEIGLNFSNLTMLAWVGGVRVFSDPSHTVNIGPSGLSVRAFPLGASVGVTLDNFYGEFVYPEIDLYAIGY